MAETPVQVKSLGLTVVDVDKSEASGAPVPDVRVSNPANCGVVVAGLVIETVIAPRSDPLVVVATAPNVRNWSPAGLSVDATYSLGIV